MKYVVDIDDTLLYSDYEDGSYVLKSANIPLIDKINKLYEKGNEIILYTGRHWNHLKVTIQQLKEYGVMYHSLIMGKPVGDFYIDDKAITPDTFLALYEG